MVTLSDAAATLAAYSAAVRLGVLDRIDREPANPSELAVACGVSERGSDVLLAALESTGFVERLPDGRYRPATAGLAGLHSMLPLWERLPEVVRTGRPALAADASLPFAGASPQTAAAVAARLPRASWLLEVGTGAAPLSIAVAQRDPGCQVTVLDPHATAPARRAVASAGLSDRFTFLPGDVLSTALEERAYDVVLVGQLCQLLDESTCDELIRRLASALSPGGMLAVLDVLPARPHTALFELALCLRTRWGGLHRLDTYRGWFDGAGLAVTEVVDLDGAPPCTLIAGRAAA
jgi:SAM-dependent methyltransferase